MNDAVTYISRYSLQAGNSCLKNQMDRELTFNASWRWLTLTASYDRCKNGITQWSYLEANDAVLVKHINIDKPVNTYSLYLSATPRVGIWSLNATAGVDKQHFYLDVDDNDKVQSVTVDLMEPVLHDPAQFLTQGEPLPEGVFVSIGNPNYVIFVELLCEK